MIGVSLCLIRVVDVKRSAYEATSQLGSKWESVLWRKGGAGTASGVLGSHLYSWCFEVVKRSSSPFMSRPSSLESSSSSDTVSMTLVAECVTEIGPALAL